MREYGSNIILPSLDNLFSSEQERQDAKLEKIQILSPDVVTGLTEPAITEVMYDEIQKIREEIHNEQERNL